MTAQEKRLAYQSFFLKNEAGQSFMNSVNALILSNHVAAENKPELSRDYVQRAKGARDVIAHIQSMVADRSKPK